METIFKNKVKNSIQIKTKDQNLKNKYFFKTNKKTDLLDLSVAQLNLYINKKKKLLEKTHNDNFLLKQRI